ncbi:MAG: LacI family DNA-binding transcriptional regulator [Alicyclobacillus sp.]|nr:LacI family DNA-binding transcriptional regulator [Alicyclobacillus sp.]
MAKRVTMQQIADAAGVSKFAVSKALSGQPGVGAETRERIIKIATQLGYFLQEGERAATSSASSADGPKPKTVIILLPNVRMQHRQSSYWGRIIDGIIDALKRHDLAMITVTEHAPEDFLRVLNPQGVLGIIGVGLVANPLLLEIRRLGIPFVLVDHEDDAVPSDSIFVDNFDAVSRLTNYLIGLGHQRLQFVGHVRYASSFFDRWLAFRTMLEQHDLPVLQDAGLMQINAVERAEQSAQILERVRALAANEALPTAFVCANDALAISTMEALDTLGIHVPTDVSVTGFDDIDESVQASPPLTTVHVDKEYLGTCAVDILLRRLANPHTPIQKWLVKGRLVFRDSTARVQKHGTATVLT